MDLPELLVQVFDNLGTWRNIVRAAGVCRMWREIILRHVWDVDFAANTAGYAITVLRTFSFSKITVKSVIFLQDKNVDALGAIIANIFNRTCSTTNLTTMDANLIHAVCSRMQKKINSCHFAMINIPDMPAMADDGTIVTRHDPRYVNTPYYKAALKSYRIAHGDGKLDGIAREVKLTPTDLIFSWHERLIDDSNTALDELFLSSIRSNTDGLRYMGSHFERVYLKGVIFAEDEKYKSDLSQMRCDTLILIDCSATRPNAKKIIVASNSFVNVCPNDCTEELYIRECRIEPGVYPNIKIMRYRVIQSATALNIMFPNAKIAKI